jgi:hypothetical protein
MKFSKIICCEQVGGGISSVGTPIWCLVCEDDPVASLIFSTQNQLSEYLKKENIQVPNIYNYELHSIATDEGFVLDIYDDKENIQATETFFLDDLEEQYKSYLKDMANDDNCDVTTIEDWDTWLEEEIESKKEDMLKWI